MLSRTLLWVSMAMLLCVSLGCSTSPIDATALRRRFPEQAGAVLEGRSSLASDARDELASTGMRVRLPPRGEGALRFALPGGDAIEVRELGASGDATPAEQAVAYARPGGASFWSATDTGIEEWLWLDPDAVRSSAPVAVWEVTGAALVERGDAVEVVDGTGAPRVRVTAPQAYAEGGRPVATRLAVRGPKLELWVAADGEAVLVDPGWVGLKQSMHEARQRHTATLLPSGSVLVTGGDDGKGPDATADVFDPSSKRWAETPPMSAAREDHTATLLPDGRVLVAGGTGAKLVSVTSVDVFDPASQIWTPTTPMATARSGHTATLLSNGRVLVAGGGSGASAEVFDPVSQTWTPTSPMNVSRQGHTATLLVDGHVLVAGGDPDGSAEMFDPLSLAWTETSPMKVPRSSQTATLLSNGRVIVAGGSSGPLSMGAEIFDPAAQTWTITPPMHQNRFYHSATRLSDGRVLVAGGVVDVGDLSVDDGAEAYDPSLQAWTPIEPMGTPRSSHTATGLADGRVLVAGGMGTSKVLATAEVFDTSSARWTPAAPLGDARSEHSATLLEGGQVLVAGGRGPLGAVLASAEVWGPSADVWTSAPPLRTARAGHTATRLADGRVLVAGGYTGLAGGTVGADDDRPEGQIDGAEVFDPASQTWTPTPPMVKGRSGHTATLLPDGRVLVAGGVDLTGMATPSAEVFDPAARTWEPAVPMTAAREDHTAMLLPDGRVLVAGGGVPTVFDFVDPLQSAEVYDPASQTWTPIVPMMTPRQSHTATLVSDGRVLVAGGDSTFNLGADTASVSTAVELFDPSAGTWTTMPAMSVARGSHTATGLLDGRVLTAGGDGIDATFQLGMLASVELFDLAAGTWTTMPSMGAARARHTATRLDDGRVLVVGGGERDEAPLASAEIFSLQPDGTGCGTPQDCQSGFCVQGVCCDQACADGLCEACSELAGAVADGTCTQLHPECTPFACSPVTGACNASCQTIRDCAAGYACDPTGACVSSTPNQAYRDESGCTLSSPDEPAPTPAGFALLAALAAARRARRRRAPYRAWSSPA